MSGCWEWCETWRKRNKKCSVCVCALACASAPRVEQINHLESENGLNYCFVTNLKKKIFFFKIPIDVSTIIRAKFKLSNWNFHRKCNFAEAWCVLHLAKIDKLVLNKVHCYWVWLRITLRLRVRKLPKFGITKICGFQILLKMLNGAAKQACKVEPSAHCFLIIFHHLQSFLDEEAMWTVPLICMLVFLIHLNVFRIFSHFWKNNHSKNS